MPGLGASCSFALRAGGEGAGAGGVLSIGRLAAAPEGHANRLLAIVLLNEAIAVSGARLAVVRGAPS